MVSAAKLRRAQDNIIMMRPYAAKLKELIGNLRDSSADQAALSALTQVRDVKKVLIIVVTSNKGLCGAFNTNINRLTANLIADRFIDQHNAGNVQLLCIGKYGFEFFNRRKFNILDNSRSHLDL